MKAEGLLATIAEKAQERGLPFLVGGGHAVILHGFERATFDLDLIINRAEKDYWAALFADFGFHAFAEAQAFLQLTPPDDQTPAVDLLLMNEATFGKLMAASLPAPPEYAGVKVISLQHLLALKCHAIKYGHRGRIVKDVDDVIRLVKNNGVNLRAPDIQELILTHGTPELYDKLLHATGQ